ncbi:uncharacterized protein HRG_02759 [Hirsutella rhossiliensis]|uniref:Uncharacterized protein n=1 Tax=Hirsutella rhossiliensis TaxID=111463 RepID=A0A9P8N5K4_9HYPO|nr:uncharacterized protein HRG_02759 [Hirsutella rhossiliensis]KAH0967350.1 hypothetical protein HRG_02759 [Hirsutella rhossiliensis]
MCTYARTVFECKHHAWGRRLKLCAVAESHRAGDLPSGCALRKPHGLHSRRVPRQCHKCSELDRKRSLLRAKLDECREMFHRQYPEYGIGLDIGAGEDMEQASDGLGSEDEDGGMGSDTSRSVTAGI